MLFMVVERFKDNDMVAVDRRVQPAGRQLHEGLEGPRVSAQVTVARVDWHCPAASGRHFFLGLAQPTGTHAARRTPQVERRASAHRRKIRCDQK
jgi:hypothetical protein